MRRGLSAARSMRAKGERKDGEPDQAKLLRRMCAPFTQLAEMVQRCDDSRDYAPGGCSRAVEPREQRREFIARRVRS